MKGKRGAASPTTPADSSRISKTLFACNRGFREQATQVYHDLVFEIKKEILL
jgi:hypothetical protein